MRLFVLVLFLFIRPLLATYVVVLGEESLDKKHRLQLFNLLLRGEPPRVYYESTLTNIEIECQRISPSIHIEWIPPALWQLAALHSFFLDHDIQKGILKCSGVGWQPISYDEMLHLHLPFATSLEEVVGVFDRQTLYIPELCDLFFKVNQAIASLYKRSGGSNLEMIRQAISELPPFGEWEARGFPFWKSPWIYNPQSAEIFYNALTNEDFFSKLVEIECIANKKGEWVLYRGYSGPGYPNTLEGGRTNSHALSFGSTLLGGVFFSLEACALTYSMPDPTSPHSFLALRVTPQEFDEVFRAGPLHPFVQMIVDGEMFHAHTKLGTDKLKSFNEQPTNGYFMKCNKNCVDPVGYIMSLRKTPRDLQAIFHSLCEKSGHIF